MNSENYSFDYERKKKLGYFGKFYAPQKDVLSLAFKVLQEEVKKEYNSLLKRGVKPSSVLKLIDNKDKKRFQVAYMNFNGKRFKEFACLSDNLTKENATDYNGFWQKITKKEEDEIIDSLCEIGSKIMNLKIKYDQLSDNNFNKKVSLKLLGYNKDSIRNDITDLSDRYVELADVLRCWSEMSQAEKKTYVARRFLFTGSLQFDAESVNSYYQKCSRREKINLKNAETFDIFE